jgi:DNA-binding GntR family transcriptional regulator
MPRASHRAYGRIRNMILAGELAPGVQIREAQLALDCGVSRTPVRDALRRLEAELFIRRNGAGRSFVANWSLGDIEDSFALRGMLEGYAARRAATRISWDQIERLRLHNRAVLRAVSIETPDVPAFLEHNRHFHTIVLEQAGSERLSGMVARVVEQPVVVRTALHYDEENLLKSWREHEDLIAAFGRRDGEWAQAVMAGHIRRAFHNYADAHFSERSIHFEVAVER